MLPTSKTANQPKKAIGSSSPINESGGHTLWISFIASCPVLQFDFHQSLFAAKTQPETQVWRKLKTRVCLSLRRPFCSDR
ncbi:hypothetical protein O181_050381 [Austropuccinia psidii MF-1]|uniref:Uncharacterized protein n=1 Tax=Austropuccinia psidii MF-1 TaxID=1389203 RepID=A0A9Q3E1Q0_9BASI|nr:hypothetical protein [Austropuccinia psidii MF-1]